MLLLLVACTGNHQGNKDPSGDSSGAFVSAIDASERCTAGDLGCLGQPALALDSAGLPWVGWIRADADRDGVYDDAVVEVQHLGSDGDWSEPAEIGPAGSLGSSWARQLDLAADGDEVSAAWFDYGTGEIHLARGTDGAFQDEIVEVTENPLQIALDARDGDALIGIVDGSGSHGHALFFPGGEQDDPIDLPLLPQTEAVANQPLSASLGGGQGYVGYWLTPDDGYTLRAAVWGIGDRDAVALIDSQEVQNDYADLDIQVDETGNVWLAARLDRADGGQAWLAQIDSEEIVEIPRDADDYYSTDIALSVRDGRESVGIGVASLGSSPRCGAPRLLSTTDGGSSFSQCEIGDAPEVGAGSTITMDEGEDGRRWVAFSTVSSYGELAPGIIVWNE